MHSELKTNKMGLYTQFCEQYYEDLKDLREAKAESKNETPVSLDEVIHELGL